MYAHEANVSVILLSFIFLSTTFLLFEYFGESLYSEKILCCFSHPVSSFLYLSFLRYLLGVVKSSGDELPETDLSKVE